jgi:hypothetical protein
MQGVLVVLHGHVQAAKPQILEIIKMNNVPLLSQTWGIYNVSPKRSAIVSRLGFEPLEADALIT